MLTTLYDIFKIKDITLHKKVTTLFIVSTLWILIAGIFTKDTYFFRLEKIYDVENYLHIAQNGYTSNHLYAFFPLFPLIIKFFDTINIPILGSIIFNNILCLLTAYLLVNIQINIYKSDSNTIRLTYAMWLLSPVRIFTFIPYTESIFIFLCVFSFYLYKQRKLPYLFGTVLGLSVMSRNMGSMLFFTLFIFLVYDYIKTKDVNIILYTMKSYSIATTLSILYPCYLQIKVGNWKYFLDVQFEHWERANSNLFKIVYSDILKLLKTPYIDVSTTILLSLTALIIILLIIINTLLKRDFSKLDLVCFSICSIFAIYSTCRFNDSNAYSTSFYRYIYGIFSIYLLFDSKSKLNWIIKIIMILSFIGPLPLIFKGWFIV